MKRLITALIKGGDIEQTINELEEYFGMDKWKKPYAVDISYDVYGGEYIPKLQLSISELEGGKTRLAAEEFEGAEKEVHDINGTLWTVFKFKEAGE
jgi:hypothetical protein